jgi:polysaccharide export outer membrane protein
MCAFLAVATCLSSGGCCLLSHEVAADPEIPAELNRQSEGAYILDTPDIVVIDALRLLPIPPYKIEPLDVLQISVTGTLVEPIAGLYSVDPDGTVRLGATYGSVQVEGMSLADAKKAIETELKKTLKEPGVQVGLAQSRAMQQIRGEHLIRPDGTVGLGIYGSVHIAGMTLEEAKASIEEHLKQYVRKPEVSVDVFSYNSKVYYVITDGGGYGEQVYRLAKTGNETVLDAISQINGLPAVASRKRIRLVRPTPDQHGDESLPVDWKAITQKGVAATNYQVLAGDRIYVEAEPLVTADTYLARIISPIERLLGVTLLGGSTYKAVNTAAERGTGNTGGGG